VSYDSTTTSVSRSAYVEISRDARGAIRGATLFRAFGEDINMLALAEELAYYLGDPDRAEAIALLLSNRADVLDRYQVSDRDLARAGTALRAARGRTHADKDESDILLDEPNDQLETEPTAVDPTPTLPTGGEPGTATASSNPVEDGADHRRAEAIRRGLGTWQRGTSRGDGDQESGLAPSRWQQRSLQFGAPLAPPAASGRRKLSRRSPEGAGRVPGPGGGGFAEADRHVEADAIAVVTKYAPTFGAVAVRDVQAENLGWDLEFVMSDGTRIPVEVKGSRGNTAFMVTRNERRAASTPGYLLLWVANLRNPDHAIIRRFRRLADELTDDHLSVLSWVVDDWQYLSFDEIPVRASD
jgi:hypothetical protein